MQESMKQKELVRRFWTRTCSIRPRCLPKCTEKWKEGFDVVEGVKTDRGTESLFHRAFTKVFYSFISKAVGMDMRNSSDYKLLDRKVIDELKKLQERNTFFRALSFWVGFKKNDSIL